MSIFSPVGSSQVTATVTDTSTSTNPVIVNLDATLAATEYTVQLPTGTKQFQLRTRGAAEVEYAYLSFGSMPPTCIIPRYCAAAVSDLSLVAPLDIFLRVSAPSQIIELQYWT